MKLMLGPTPWYFIWSLLSGFVMALVYDIIRTRRRLVTMSDLIVNVEDIIFIVFGGGVAVALAYFVNNGFFRIYSLISMIFGFVIYRTIFGGKVVDLFMCICKGISKIVCFLVNLILMPIRWLVKIIGRPLFVIVISAIGRAKGKITYKKVKK